MGQNVLFFKKQKIQIINIFLMGFILSISLFGQKTIRYQISPEALSSNSDTDNNTENPMQIYPNPGNPDISISFKVKEQSRVELKVINLLGQEVKTIVDGKRTPGNYTVKWDGKTNLNLPAPSGIYICRLRIGKKVYTQKASLVK